MAAYQDIHASLLRFCSDNATQFTLVEGLDFTPIDFDAITSDNDLPVTNILGIDNLAIAEGGDDSAGDVVATLITIGIRDDVNNTILSKVTDSIFELVRAGNQIALYDAGTGHLAGNIVFFGMARMLPIGKSEAGIIFRSISVQGMATTR